MEREIQGSETSLEAFKKSRKRWKDLTQCQRKGKEEMNIRNICMAAKSTTGTETPVVDIRLTKASYFYSCWNGVGEKH